MATDRIPNHGDFHTTGGCAGRSAALAINSAGDAVGWAQLESLSPNPYCVEFKHDGTLVNLGGAQSSLDQANGINDSGVIVGSVSNKAYIWGSVGLNGDMNTTFGSTGYNIIPGGWTLITANGIDNNGDIVGYMSNAGVTKGFVISTPVPEPSALLLIATGLVGLLAYAWRKQK